jgi:hypothetical protein
MRRFFKKDIDYAERNETENNSNISNNSPSELYSDEDSFNFDSNFEQFFEMSHIQQIMFEASNLRVADVLLMIMSYCIRYSISNAARDGLIELVKVLAGPRFKRWSCNKHTLVPLYNSPHNVIKYCFYCDTCSKLLMLPITRKKFQNCSKICEKCAKQYDLSLKSSNYFVSIDLVYQLQRLLQNNKEVQMQLTTNVIKIKNNFNHDIN